MTLTEQRLDALTEKHGEIYWAAQRAAFAKLVAEVKAHRPPPWPTCCARPMSYFPDLQHYSCPKCKRQS